MDERERQYREYLALRQDEQAKEIEREYRNAGKPAHERPRHEKQSITGDAYDVSELIHKQKEKQRLDREMNEYIAAREADRAERGVRSSVGSKNGGRNGKGGKRRRKKVKTTTLAILIVVALIGGSILTGIVVALSALGSMEHLAIDKDRIGIDPGVAQDLEGYTNIAVLGIDARADEDDSNARSDAIIVASINNETDEVKMFSVYRDTLLDVGDEGLDKITHAYFYGGAERSLYALNRNLDLNIEEAVVINWKTVADVIDSVGGIEIDVQESELDELNKFIHETAINVDGPADKLDSAGKQRLNGVQAVTYARIRKDAITGDYRRNERMKIVFKQTFKEVKNAGPLKMFSVATHAMPEIKTSLGAGDILGMMMKFKSYDMTDSTTGFPYDVGSWTGYGGAGYAWYGPPRNLANNVSKLHGQFFDQKDYTPTETVQSISNEISVLTGIW